MTLDVPRRALTRLCLLGLLVSSVAIGGQLNKGIFVPEGAQAVDSVRWRDITSFTPLSRELILVRTRSRPYLLTLKRACPGLRSDSIIVTEQENGYFEPATDLLRAAPPPNSGIGPIALNGSGKFSRNGLMEGTTRCRPDALFATDDEGVAWVEAAIDEQGGRKSTRKSRKSGS